MSDEEDPAREEEARVQGLGKRDLCGYKCIQKKSKLQKEGLRALRGGERQLTTKKNKAWKEGITKRKEGVRRSKQRYKETYPGWDPRGRRIGKQKKGLKRCF